MRGVPEDKRICPTCEGRGYLTVFAKPHLCPKCKGERYISNAVRLGGSRV